MVIKKSDFAKVFRIKAGIKTQVEADRYVDNFIETLKFYMLQNEKVIFKGLGTFYVKESKRTEFKNPLTQEDIKVETKKRVKFRAGKEITDKLNMKK